MKGMVIFLILITLSCVAFGQFVSFQVTTSAVQLNEYIAIASAAGPVTISREFNFEPLCLTNADFNTACLRIENDAIACSVDLPNVTPLISDVEAASLVPEPAMILLLGLSTAASIVNIRRNK